MWDLTITYKTKEAIWEQEDGMREKYPELIHDLNIFENEFFF